MRHGVHVGELIFTTSTSELQHLAPPSARTLDYFGVVSYYKSDRKLFQASFDTVSFEVFNFSVKFCDHTTDMYRSRPMLRPPLMDLSSATCSSVDYVNSTSKYEQYTMHCILQAHVQH